MSIQTDSNTWWPLGFSDRDAARFIALVQDCLDTHELAFSGTAPILENDDGCQLFLGNLAEQCAKATRARWPAIIEEFIASLAGITKLPDLLAISPDVVRRSLRLRMYPSSAIPDPTPPELRSDERSTRDLLGLVVRRPALPGTEWLLHLRRPGVGQGVIAEHLEEWGIDVEEAFALARDNTLNEEGADVFERRRVLLASGGSMFSHAAVLTLGSRFPADRGFIVGVPNRNEAVAASIAPKRSGIERMVEAIRVIVERFDANPYRIHSGAWFVPPGGLGLYGEAAEPIGLVADGPLCPEWSVKFGPNTKEYFAALG